MRRRGGFGNQNDESTPIAATIRRPEPSGPYASRRPTLPTLAGPFPSPAATSLCSRPVSVGRPPWASRVAFLSGTKCRRRLREDLLGGEWRRRRLLPISSPPAPL